MGQCVTSLVYLIPSLTFLLKTAAYPAPADPSLPSFHFLDKTSKLFLNLHGCPCVLNSEYKLYEGEGLSGFILVLRAAVAQ